MARPTYENDLDRQREEELARLVAQRTGLRPAKLPVQYRVDFALYRQNALVAVAEMKYRDYTVEQLDRWGGYYVSLSKIMGAETICRMTDIPFYVVINFKGDIRVATIAYPFPVVAAREGGRKDRGDWQDLEPVVCYMSRHFTPLATARFAEVA
jgi:hypothetical protein